MRFEFATATRVIFGPGSALEAAPLARGLGRRVLLVTGKNPRRAEGLPGALGGQGMTVFPFPVQGEPDLETVEHGIILGRREGCELVIGLGGGSVLDAGKAIAAMLGNPGGLLDYLEIIGRGRTLDRPGLPFIAMPTTAGTGSEVTRNAVLASPKDRLKVSLRSPFLLPSVAIVDPELTWALPPALTASTGLDALTQLIEPYVCSRANPMTDGLCMEGIRRVARSLRKACAEGGNAAAREDMSLAGLFGGMALANAGLGAVHGLAGPIGGMFPAPHGAVCAALLPGVMAANLGALRRQAPEGEALRRFRNVARWLTGSEAATADEGVEWVRHLVADLGVPGLGAYGITRDDSSAIAFKAEKASSMKANPVNLTLEELKVIVEQAL